MQEMKIGWSSRDIGTDKPVTIPGQFHQRISRGVHDPVTVSVLVLDNGDDTVIFVSADVVVIRYNLLDDIRAAVSSRNPDIPVSKILMNATHTHTGPSVYGEGAGANDEAADGGTANMEVNKAYRAFFTRQTVDAILEAHAGLAPGGIAYGYGYAVVGHSRRAVYFDDLSKRPGATVNSTHGVNGHACMYGQTDDAQFSHYEAGADHFINLLYTFDPAGKLTGAVVNVPCPAQNSENETMLSASFWNEVRETIRARHGNVFLLAQSAAGGDLSPRILHYKQAQERRLRLKYGEQEESIAELNARRDIAERIAHAFDETLAWAGKDIRTSAPLKHVVETVELSKRLITPEEAAEEKARLAELLESESAQAGNPHEASVIYSGIKRCRNVLQRFETQDKEPKLPMEMHVVRIGDIAFASNRFELYMDYMHRIQARSPAVQTFIVQLVAIPGSAGGSYLATERGVRGKGYSASRYCNMVSPQGGQEMVEQTLSILDGLF